MSNISELMDKVHKSIPTQVGEDFTNSFKNMPGSRTAVQNFHVKTPASQKTPEFKPPRMTMIPSPKIPSPKKIAIFLGLIAFAGLLSWKNDWFKNKPTA